MSREQSLARGSPRRRNRPWASLTTALGCLWPLLDLHGNLPFSGTRSCELGQSRSSLPRDRRRSRARGHTGPPAPTWTTARPAGISDREPGTLRGTEGQPSPAAPTPAPPSTHPPAAAAAAAAACLSRRLSGRPVCEKRRGRREEAGLRGDPWEAGGARALFTEEELQSRSSSSSTHSGQDAPGPRDPGDLPREEQTRRGPLS